jgi:hypothetical protein
MKAIQDEQFDDLKQLIETTAFQTENNLKEDMKSGLKELENKLISRMDEGFAGGGEAIDISNDVVDEKLKDHELRISTLERTA